MKNLTEVLAKLSVLYKNTFFEISPTYPLREGHQKGRGRFSSGGPTGNVTPLAEGECC